MISVTRDPYSGDYAYKTRHARVAQILFRQVCDDDVSRAAQFIHLIDGFDVGYSSDRRALEGICRGRSLTDNFNYPTGVRDIYQAAVSIAPRQAYLYQQWAIFESTHPSGDLIQAENLAETASSMEPGKPSVPTHPSRGRPQACEPGRFAGLERTTTSSHAFIP